MILDVLRDKLIEYQKARDSFRVGVYRFLIADIKNKEIEMRSQNVDFADKHVLRVIEKQIAQRKESIEAFKMGNRQDLVDKESAELEVLEDIFQMVSPHES